MLSPHDPASRAELLRPLLTPDLLTVDIIYSPEEHQ